jgi:ABC-type phosphate transport system permease subunit
MKASGQFSLEPDYESRFTQVCCLFFFFASLFFFLFALRWFLSSHSIPLIEQAECTFKHQKVWDPATRTLRPVTPYPDNFPNAESDLDFAGP